MTRPVNYAVGDGGVVAGGGMGIADCEQPWEYAELESERLGDVRGERSGRADGRAGPRGFGGREWR